MEQLLTRFKQQCEERGVNRTLRAGFVQATTTIRQILSEQTAGRNIIHARRREANSTISKEEDRLYRRMEQGDETIVVILNSAASYFPEGLLKKDAGYTHAILIMEALGRLYTLSKEFETEAMDNTFAVVIDREIDRWVLLMDQAKELAGKDPF